MATINPPIHPHGNVRVEVYEYDPITEESTRRLGSFNFDKTTLLEFSTPIVIKMNVTGVQKIDNIKIGIVKSSITLTSGGSTNPDGSMSEGNVGIEHSTALNQRTCLTSFFGGLNTTESPSNGNNVSINNLSNTESEYLYLSMKMPDTTTRGYIGLKWFFDFV